MGQGEENNHSSVNGNVEEPLRPENGGKSPNYGHPDQSHTPGRCCLLQQVMVPVVMLVGFVVLLLALATAVAVPAAKSSECSAAVLGCPSSWVGYGGMCYYLSQEEGSWQWGQERCWALNASLAVLKEPWELEFLRHLKGNVEYWLGLRRRGQNLEWVDGSSFNQTFKVRGREDCLVLDDGYLTAATCSQLRPYLCSKPSALL
ncbi:C-type lectin domain family 2 member B-like [Tyto alba]|uniref:C-type lectin domain family 2 member B-like n=1 Tax=Tyto alba TaxID=56313 RepID=UPI001C6752F5|nr:C-type lectin domain family 2 member B-like [Tyto alba]